MDNSIIADYYEPLLTDNHFIPADDNNSFNSAGQCWRLSHEFEKASIGSMQKKTCMILRFTTSISTMIFSWNFNLPWNV